MNKDNLGHSRRFVAAIGALLLYLLSVTLGVTGNTLTRATASKAGEMMPMGSPDQDEVAQTMLNQALDATANVDRLHFVSRSKITLPDGQTSFVISEGDYIVNEGTFTRTTADNGITEVLSLQSDSYVKQGGIWSKYSFPAGLAPLFDIANAVKDPSNVVVPVWGSIRPKDYVFKLMDHPALDKQGLRLLTGAPSGPEALSAITKSTLTIWVNKDSHVIVRLRKTNEYELSFRKRSDTTMTFSRFNDPDIALPKP